MAGVGFVIRDLYAFVAVHADGDEGLLAIGQPAVPMIAADRTRLDDLRPYAQAIAKAQHLSIKLVRFTVREEIETL